ncbi:MAG: hypothetical protein J6L88_01025 [Clostridia bacterium]|nr:hypothetical protein [Clostridia bacterium]
MRWLRNHIRYIIYTAGYILFACTAIFSFRFLVGKRVGMDPLIAFLLSQTLGMLVLHYMRAGFRKKRLTFHQYSTFLLVNVLVILSNAFVMYVMNVSQDSSETRLQVFSTIILLIVNAILQEMQHRQTDIVQ